MHEDALFSPEERLIYRYFTGMFDGKKQFRSADPWVLWRTLMAHGGEVSADLQVSESAHSGRLKAHEDLMARLCEIFSVERFHAKGDGSGLTDLEIKALLNHFLTYCGSVKKNSSASPTSAATTSPGTPPSSSPGEGAPSPTPSSSPSASTGSGTSTDSPTPSPSA